MGAGFVYRDAMLRPALGIPALIVVAIAGTAAVVASRSSEKRLHDNESRFRQLFDISPFPAVVTSLRENRVLAINQRTSDRFGISQSKAVGAHAPDFYVDPSQRELMVEQLTKNGQVEGLLIQLRTPSGELFWADTSARLITFEGEQATLSVFHDATERVAAEQALRASEQRLASENKALTELMVRQAGNLARFDDQLRDILETCAVTVGVERVSMWRFEAERSAIRCVDLYERQAASHSSGQVLLRSEFSTYFETLEKERLIAAIDAHSDPRTAHFSEPYLKPLGIGAMLDVPLRQEDATIGVLCLEHVGGQRTWTADEQNFALSLSRSHYARTRI